MVAMPHDAFAALTPMTVPLEGAPVDDECFRVEGVRECQTEWESWPTSASSSAAAAPVVASQWHYPKCGHDFPPELRELAWQFVSDVLSAAAPNL